MKVVLLAGGLGTRLSEETHLKPKPMVEIAGKPILWHIMKIYSAHGFNDFIICLGYKGYIIKEYFLNYYMKQSDITVDMKNNEVKVHNSYSEPWTITLVDTGYHTMTGGRINKIKPYVGDEPFMLTYGDGVGNVDIKALVDYHKNHGKDLTMTVVQPSGRFGNVAINDNDGNVLRFEEKPEQSNSWINAGFFVCNPGIFDAIEDNDDTVVWERQPLETISGNGQLQAFKHYGFWKPMDTLREKKQLEQAWTSGNAEWKIWED